jgi:hypothetical protein
LAPVRGPETVSAPVRVVSAPVVPVQVVPAKVAQVLGEQARAPVWVLAARVLAAARARAVLHVD